ncbi:hypothetical protein MMPV_005299 [Pyropia vietnamensis]
MAASSVGPHLRSTKRTECPSPGGSDHTPALRPRRQRRKPVRLASDSDDERGTVATTAAAEQPPLPASLPPLSPSPSARSLSRSGGPVAEDDAAAKLGAVAAESKVALARPAATAATAAPGPGSPTACPAVAGRRALRVRVPSEKAAQSAAVSSSSHAMSPRGLSLMAGPLRGPSGKLLSEEELRHAINVGVTDDLDKIVVDDSVARSKVILSVRKGAMPGMCIKLPALELPAVAAVATPPPPNLSAPVATSAATPAVTPVTTTRAGDVEEDGRRRTIRRSARRACASENAGDAAVGISAVAVEKAPGVAEEEGAATKADGTLTAIGRAILDQVEFFGQLPPSELSDTDVMELSPDERLKRRRRKRDIVRRDLYRVAVGATAIAVTASGREYLGPRPGDRHRMSGTGIRGPPMPVRPPWATAAAASASAAPAPARARAPVPAAPAHRPTAGRAVEGIGRPHVGMSKAERKRARLDREMLYKRAKRARLREEMAAANGLRGGVRVGGRGLPGKGGRLRTRGVGDVPRLALHLRGNRPAAALLEQLLALDDGPEPMLASLAPPAAERNGHGGGAADYPSDGSDLRALHRQVTTDAQLVTIEMVANEWRRHCRCLRAHYPRGSPAHAAAERLFSRGERTVGAFRSSHSAELRAAAAAAAAYARCRRARDAGDDSGGGAALSRAPGRLPARATAAAGAMTVFANDRDAKGHSVIGKRSSSKVISMIMGLPPGNAADGFPDCWGRRGVSAAAAGTGFMGKAADRPHRALEAVPLAVSTPANGQSPRAATSDNGNAAVVRAGISTPRATGTAGDVAVGGTAAAGRAAGATGVEGGVPLCEPSDVGDIRPVARTHTATDAAVVGGDGDGVLLPEPLARLFRPPPPAPADAVGHAAVVAARRTGPPRILWAPEPRPAAAPPMRLGHPPNVPPPPPPPPPLPADPFTVATGTLTCARTDAYDWCAEKTGSVTQWRPYLAGAPTGAVRRRGSVGGAAADAAPLPTSAAAAAATGSGSLGGEPSAAMEEESSAAGAAGSAGAAAVAAPLPSGGVPLALSDDERRYQRMRSAPKRFITLRSGIHGIGLFTLDDIAKDEFVMEYTGELIRSPLGDVRERAYEAEGLGTYLFKLSETEIVDATRRSNRARFLNHSCDPLLQSETAHLGGRPLVILRVKHPVPAFTELTLDYQLPLEDKKITCSCGSRKCRGFLN